MSFSIYLWHRLSYWMTIAEFDGAKVIDFDGAEVNSLFFVRRYLIYMWDDAYFTSSSFIPRNIHHDLHHFHQNGMPLEAG